jgi:hypothetical protein
MIAQDLINWGGLSQLLSGSRMNIPNNNKFTIMKSITTLAGKEIEVYHAQAVTSGHGHKKITVELRYGNMYEKFTATTDNMPAFDDAQEFQGAEYYQALYDIIENQIEDRTTEWLDRL